MPILHHEDRPWGHFDWIFDSRLAGQTLAVGQSGKDDAGFIIKSLFVLPGKRLSDQRHKNRKETWFVQSGTATVYLELPDSAKETKTLKAGEMVEFPEMTWHRLSAENSKEPVIITEVWQGKKLDEDDIERRSDDYGRK